MTLVTIGLPVRNAQDRVVDVARSVLAQDHSDIELVISDNASTDDTEAVCRDMAETDSRVRYHRQTENVGILGNFRTVMGLGRGTYFRWIGDDDWIDPTYVRRCLEVIAERPKTVLVTTRIEYTSPAGTTATPARYDGSTLASPDPVERLEALLGYLNESEWFVDPMYSLLRRAPALAIPRRNTLREDEVYASRLALAGPWEHIPALLAHRHLRPGRLSSVARRLGVPTWQVRATTLIVSRGILAGIDASDLDAGERRRAHAAVRRFYVRRQARTVRHRCQRLHRIARSAIAGRERGQGAVTI
jgi:glycosyltransferase involved in cell wall biosynthesis